MATPASSSLFMRLTKLFRILFLRSDIDNIILELLGHFSLEKIYSEGDKETYQNLVITLLAQLNAIFNVQRLTLPTENLQLSWYLGFLASWEVSLRAVESVLQIIVEGREFLWEARLLREKYLAEFLVNALRFLTLHPKIPASQRAKDRRDRFARIHRLLERIFDSYPGPGSFLLLVCREITDSLRTEPNGLVLPPRLRLELPNLASELYPLADCLSSQYISTIVPQDGLPGDWLVQFLALRDVSHFVVGASIQYSMNKETRDVRLQSSSARTRNAVLHALEYLRMPDHLSKIDLMAMFSDTFRIILPDTLNLGRRGSTESEEGEIDAIDLLCAKLNDRQVLTRVSDHELAHCISEATRNIALLDDPSGQFRAARPRIWVLNCSRGHLAGESQLKTAEVMNFPVDGDGSEVVPLPPHAKCIHCGGAVTLAREVALARHTWDLLRPLESNADAINVERHLPTQFLLASPKLETGMPFHSGFGNILSVESSRMHDPKHPYSPPEGRTAFPGSLSSDRPNLVLQSLISPQTQRAPALWQKSDTSRAECTPAEALTSTDGLGYIETRKISDALRRPSNRAVESTLSTRRGAIQSRLQSVSTVTFEPDVLCKSRTAPLVAPTERGKSKWRSKITGSRKEPLKTTGDSSSLSSTTLESQRLQEISLRNLVSSSKSSARGKSSKNINVYLSQNSTYALFWTQTAINVWDVGSSPPLLGRAISTDSNCVLAVATKLHLAYIIGNRDQKLTLRILNLVQTTIPIIEYRMPSSPWCSSMTICPQENQIVVGFDNSIVRFFKTNNSEEPREDRLHSRFHKDCKNCPAVDTLSFSNDGLVLLASSRARGTIQVYSWRFPFLEFQELAPCRYHVPLHESEDNGISSAIFRSETGSEESLVCITTWTQSGIPVLIQPHDGHRSEVRTEPSSHQGKLGSRIQCAAFSPTGRELAMVNDKGHLYIISNLNANPLEVRRIATSKELTIKSDWFSMQFMSLSDEEAIVLAWADPSKAMGYVKKIPVRCSDAFDFPITPLTPTPTKPDPRYELPGEEREIPRQQLELAVTEFPAPLNIIKGYSKEEEV